MRKRGLSLPFLCYLTFSFVVILAYLYYRPSWGVVDDWQHIQTVNPIWESPNTLKSLFESIKFDLLGGKIRSVHWVYAFIVYKFFNNAVFLIYILNFLVQIAVLPLWGLIFHKMFSKESRVSQDTLFIFPLSFFIFTPFWNNFMYISVQEKLVFFFSTIAIYFFMLTYDKNKTRYLFLSFIFAFLCLFSKPTGVYIILTFLACSLIYCLIYRKNLVFPALFLSICSLILAAYYLLISSVVKPGGYSSRYMDNFNIAGVLSQLKQSSIVVKALFAAAVISLPPYLLLIKKKYFNFCSILVPVGFISYLFVILPWGTSNYFLGPLAPFALGMFFPAYCLAKRKLSKFKLNYLPGIAVVLLSFLVLTQIIIPRINKIAEIKDVEAEIIKLKHDKINARFYFPPDYPETSFALSQFTKVEIVYLSQGTLDAAMLSGGDNYLIYRDECSMIKLKNVKLAKTVFQDNTWKIFEVIKAANTQTLNIEFPRTLLQRIVRFFKRS